MDYLKKIIKKFVANGLSQFDLGQTLLATFSLRGYLGEKGWLLSRSRLLPLNCVGSPLPWYTYSFISFIRPKLRADMSVFEYGSGNSTLWWAERVSYVTACEHDRAWYDLTGGKLPGNVDYMFCLLEPRGRYSEMCGVRDSKYDCIIIDGRNRILCAAHAIKQLKDDGVIVWDNSDRSKYKEGYDLLVDAGFKRLDFWGLGPINSYEWCTSIFYRKDNCLGI